jgi:hypothetical protein
MECHEGLKAGRPEVASQVAIPGDRVTYQAQLWERDCSSHQDLMGTASKLACLSTKSPSRKCP